MNLQAEITKHKAQSATRVSTETLHSMQQATLDLKQQDLENRALKAGDQVPDFNLLGIPAPNLPAI
jgi:hypothetical protein